MVPCVSDPICAMDLLRTCRQIYSETALLPYNGNVYYFWGIRGIRSEVRYLKPFQRAQIKSIALRSLFCNGLDAYNERSTNSPKAVLDYLPGLERIHIIVIACREPILLNIIPNSEARGKKAVEELESLVSGKSIDITFEVDEESSIDCYKQ
jgi:hypothetical protein